VAGEGTAKAHDRETGNREKVKGASKKSGQPYDEGVKRKLGNKRVRDTPMYIKVEEKGKRRGGRGTRRHRQTRLLPRGTTGKATGTKQEKMGKLAAC